MDDRPTRLLQFVTIMQLPAFSSVNFQSLLKLFNECIRKGEWPAAWKKGEWNPVHKKDDRLDERKYRPITLLSTVDKVYESMMSIQVNNHFDSELDPCLSAYRKKTEF